MAQSDIVYYSQPNIYGTQFKCSKRTAEHLDRTKYRLRKLGEKNRKQYVLRIIQGSYNTTVEASAGTHDKDAVLDVQIVGMDWYEAQKFLRKNGWAAWVRTPAQGFSYHIHMISLPKYKQKWVAPVGQYVPGQVDDYYIHQDGLAGGGDDPTWFPPNIKRTIFNYNLWVAVEATRRQITSLSKKLSDARKKLRNLFRR
jgi:hypothetical protein